MAVPPNVQFDGISLINYSQIRGASVPVTLALVWWQLNGLRWTPMYDEICVLTVKQALATPEKCVLQNRLRGLGGVHL
jgi:hypothetical protein